MYVCVCVCVCVCVGVLTSPVGSAGGDAGVGSGAVIAPATHHRDRATGVSGTAGVAAAAHDGDVPLPSGEPGEAGVAIAVGATREGAEGNDLNTTHPAHRDRESTSPNAARTGQPPRRGSS